MWNAIKPPRWATPVLLGTLLFGSFAVVSATEDRFANWTMLRLKARKLFIFSGSVCLKRQQTVDGERLESETLARLFGAKLNRTRTISLTGLDGLPIRYESRTPKRGRLYQFHDTGYTVSKYAPTEAGWEAPFKSWSLVNTHRFEYPIDSEGKVQSVVDYYTMIRSLGKAPLTRMQDQVVFWVATSDGPRAFTVTVSEERTRRRRILGADGSRENVRRREFRLRIIPRNPANAREGFLSMEGETELWVDAATRTLLEVSGRVPKVPGRVVITIDQLH